jgi:iron complex transport system ATP-binding protein
METATAWNADTFALHVRGASVAAGGCTLLEGLDFSVAAPGIVAIVGPNGAGKSTLLRAMAGLEPIAGGDIVITHAHDAPRDVRALSSSERARTLGLVASDAETPHGMSVREVVGVGRFAHRAWWDWTRSEDDVTRVEIALERVGLERFAERTFDSLSAGERQRAWIALALAQDAPLLLLDEPTSHLDVRHALAVLDVLRRLAREDGRAIAVVLHDLAQAAAVADRIVVLGARTMLAYDRPETAFREGVLERAFGVPFERIRVDGTLRVFPRLHALAGDPIEPRLGGTGVT